MLTNHYNKLDSNEKILIEQVAANPAFIKLLTIQKEDLEKQLTNFWALEKESDTDYRKRHELLALKLNFVKEHLELLTGILNKNV